VKKGIFGAGEKKAVLLGLRKVRTREVKKMPAEKAKGQGHTGLHPE